MFLTSQFVAYCYCLACHVPRITIYFGVWKKEISFSLCLYQKPIFNLRGSAFQFSYWFSILETESYFLIKVIVTHMLACYLYLCNQYQQHVCPINYRREKKTSVLLSVHIYSDIFESCRITYLIQPYLFYENKSICIGAVWKISGC